jgi:acetoacetyl-CoA synthetase
VGRPLIDEVGELVCTKPMPSMPLYLWGDSDEMEPPGAEGAGPPGGRSPALGRPGAGRRYRDSYFDMYPGVWRHGDWIKITPHPESGSCGAIIYGRSDATINRHGIRMGTSELYRAVEALPEVLDSLVVDLEYLGRESWMPLFVVLRNGIVLDAALDKRIKQTIREALSARHVPNDVFQVSGIPRTLSGKKMELPVKKLLMGAAADSVLKRDAMANADCVDWFVQLAAARAARQA